MIKLEITFETLEEMRAFLGPVEQAQATEAPQEPRKPRGKAKVAVEEIAPVVEPEVTPELDLRTVELSGEKLPEPEPVTYEEVSAALLGLAKRAGRDTAVGLLSEYGVAKLTDLPRDKWAAIKSDAEVREIAL